MMSQEELRRAYTLMNRGEKKDAAQIVRNVIKNDRDNVNAWWMMSMLLEDKDKQAKALERVLMLKPDHKGAREKLRRIQPERQTSEIGQNIMATQEVMNLDWSKLKDDPHPDAQKRKAKSEVDDHKVASYAMSALIGFLVLVLVIVVGLTVRNMLNTGPSPADTAQAYINAIGDLNFERVAALTCEQYRGELEGIEQELGAMPTGMDLEDLDIDVSGITFEVIDQTDTSATVKVGGSFSFAMQGMEMSFDIEEMSDIIGDDTNVALVKENGEWRVCESSGV